jgi:Uma2 family endonuclease
VGRSTSSGRALQSKLAQWNPPRTVPRTEMSVNTNTRLMTADDLWELPDDGMRHELVRGELRTMPPTGLGHADHESLFDGSLGPYVRRHQLGRVFTGEPGFVLATNPDTVRAPDVAFITRERLQASGVPTGYFHGAPDLAVEIVSPNDRYTEVSEKVAEWLTHGTRLVLVADPRRRTVTAYRPDQTFRIYGIDDALSGEDVVPGWSLSVRELFDQG